MAVSLNTNRVLCQHTNHLFDHPFCKTEPLIKKISNVAFHVFTLCIPLAIYKILPFVTKFIKPAKPIDLSDLAVDDKRKIITQLPEWFLSHFPEVERGILCRSTYKDYNFDITGKTDREIGKIFQEQIDLIQNDFTNGNSKTGIILRALTIPKNDPKLAAVVREILKNSWAKVLKMNRFHYSECNNGIMTYDSRAVLREVLKNAAIVNGDGINQKKYEMWNKEAKTCRVYSRLSVGAATESRFTIGIGKPAGISLWFPC